MKTSIFLLLVLASSVFAQKTFDLKNASKYFDVKVRVAKCDDEFCSGKATFSFYKKGALTAYQVINLPDTLIQLDGSKPLVNDTLLYDEQSVIDVGDYNFDGMEDVAICKGANGSYGMPAYNIYLSSRAAGKFVYSAAFSKLGSHLGMFTVDRKEKTLETFDKSGCCWHITERYKVVNDRPVKVFEEVEDATADPNGKRVKVTTKKLLAGKWKTSVRYEKAEQ
ncbi:MAG TPA: hypothetical protein VEV84_04255 [Pyrinomonadaceae bacterium]|jgi:hypothetical protein|nr:hypothetical protein [Pyrinomonadaceae bacterium]